MSLQRFNVQLIFVFYSFKLCLVIETKLKNLIAFRFCFCFFDLAAAMNHPQTSKQAKNQTINTYIAKQVHAVFKFKYKISYLHKSMGLVIQRFILSALISLREIGRNVRKQYCETLAQKCQCRLQISLLIQVINCKMPTDIERHHHFMDACIINCSRKLIH